MIVKLLTEDNLESLSLKGGCTGSAESTLVKMPHCWKSHVTAHFTFLQEDLQLVGDLEETSDSDIENPAEDFEAEPIKKDEVRP